jgi:hypothetical protein
VATLHAFGGGVVGLSCARNQRKGNASSLALRKSDNSSVSVTAFNMPATTPVVNPGRHLQQWCKETEDAGIIGSGMFGRGIKQITVFSELCRTFLCQNPFLPKRRAGNVAGNA